jgi:hypothetical protein
MACKHCKHISMGQLADNIASRTKYIEDYLVANGLSHPSFFADGPLVDYIPGGNADIQEARRELREASKLLASLCAGPRRHLYDVSMYGVSISGVKQDGECKLTKMTAPRLQRLTLLYTWEIPKRVPLEGTISYLDLCRATGLEEDALTRAVRYAMTLHIFCEPEPGRVSHSAISKLLITDEASWAWLGNTSSVAFPTVSKKVEALQKWPGSRSATETGFQLAFNTDLTPFGYADTVLQGKP